MLHRLFYLSLFIAITGSCVAQVGDSTRQAAKDTVARKKTRLVLGFTYNSNMNYYGRTDSLVTAGVCPFIGISFKDGLYLNSTFVFIRNTAESRYAATLLEGGYGFENKKETWAGNISVTQFFYQSGTGLIASVIKQDAAASITHLNKIVDITLGADVKFSNSTDPGAQAGLDHIIRFTRLLDKKDVLVLDPSAYVYAGTQHFIQTFYQQQHFLLFPTGETQQTQNVDQFNVLAYEFSMPVVYAYRKFNLIVTPAYILPQNVSGPGVAGPSLFYVTATAKFTL